jgi:hypothetical protein
MGRHCQGVEIDFLPTNAGENREKIQENKQRFSSMGDGHLI